MEFNELKDMPIGDILKLTTFKFGELGVYYKNVTIDTDMEDGASPKKFDLDMEDPDIVADLIDPDTLLGEAYDMWNFSDDVEPTQTSGILTNQFGGFGNIDNFMASVFDGYIDGINKMQGSEGNEAMDEIAEWEFPDPDDDDENEYEDDYEDENEYEDEDDYEDEDEEDEDTDSDENDYDQLVDEYNALVDQNESLRQQNARLVKNNSALATELNAEKRKRQKAEERATYWQGQYNESESFFQKYIREKKSEPDTEPEEPETEDIEGEDDYGLHLFD